MRACAEHAEALTAATDHADVLRLLEHALDQKASVEELHGVKETAEGKASVDMFNEVHENQLGANIRIQELSTKLEASLDELHDMKQTVEQKLSIEMMQGIKA